MSERKTYLIAQTMAETPELWLAQTGDFSDLLRRCAAQGGGLAKLTVFHLTLDSVQKNNSMEAKLLERLAVIPPRDFQLWVDEMIRKAQIGRSTSETRLLLTSALEQIQSELQKGPPQP